MLCRITHPNPCHTWYSHKEKIVLSVMASKSALGDWALKNNFNPLSPNGDEKEISLYISLLVQIFK